jgi:hypothetical protein
MPRNRIYSDNWNREDFAVVGVPKGAEGEEMRRYLRRQELAGECKLKYTGNFMRHDDGQLYEDVMIISTHRTAPEDIASMANAYHPGNEDAAIGGPCESCRGKGCQDCGYTGMQAP